MVTSTFLTMIESFVAVNKGNQAFTYILNDTVRYTKNYQYDVAGMTDYLITGKKLYGIRIFSNATGNEAIAAVSTFFNTTVDYEISIYVNDVLQLTQNGRHEGSGYYTIPLKRICSCSCWGYLQNCCKTCKSSKRICCCSYFRTTFNNQMLLCSRCIILQ